MYFIVFYGQWGSKMDLTFWTSVLVFFCVFLRMIKRILFLCTFLVLVTIVNGQKISKLKIEDVVKSFSANNDTVYVVIVWQRFVNPVTKRFRIL